MKTGLIFIRSFKITIRHIKPVALIYAYFEATLNNDTISGWKTVSGKLSYEEKKRSFEVELWRKSNAAANYII